MDITLLPAAELNADHVSAWSRIRRDNPDLDSPFFHPEFTAAVGAVRSDAEVGVLKEQGDIVGFFPFQRKRWNVGKPIGGRLSDCQALVARAGFACDAEELMRGCRLSAFDFDHMLTSQPLFQPYHRLVTRSPFIDLGRGFESYCSGRIKEMLSTLARKRRQCVRDVGPVWFEAHTSCNQVFDTLVAWKGAQYRRSRVTNVFAHRWATELLRRLVEKDSDEFGGRISALYVGERLAAAELWLRSGSILHSWFPAYDPAFGKYSPGMLLMEDTIRTAQSLGISRIELGRGTTQFKTGFMSGAADVAEGSVACHPAARAWRSTWQFARQQLEQSRRTGPVRLLGRWTRPIRSWMAFH